MQVSGLNTIIAKLEALETEFRAQTLTAEQLTRMSKSEFQQRMATIDNLQKQAFDFLSELQALQLTKSAMPNEFVQRIKAFKQLANEQFNIHVLPSLKHEIGVRLTIERFCQTKRPEERRLILGCGKVEGFHEHAQDYCVDIDPNMEPDAELDITGPGMRYFPDGSFHSIVLENLDTNIFDEGALETFREFYRILTPGGRLEFNEMFGMDSEKYCNSPFLLVVSEEVIQNLGGKMPPELLVRYKNQVKGFLESIGFRMGQDYRPNEMQPKWVVIK